MLVFIHEMSLEMKSFYLIKRLCYIPFYCDFENIGRNILTTHIRLMIVRRFPLQNILFFFY